MAVRTALAVVPSSDLERSRAWWVALLGREPDRVPMPTDLEWSFPDGGGLQLVDDGERAGSGGVTLGVEDVDAELAEIAGRGLEVPDAATVPSGQFRIAMLQDPDGNGVVLAQDLTG
ncbi:VOC family protein [Litorihabitans aurantiacus]|uniref:Glyoxalase n=1 Tax=Litorihabitans aurantiacus TaxID=1930061 RepID=A0AA37UTM0_9MICO|nr:VOC family protein [Litorihabitans aurantiacus]GMA31025.1 glyoxalase [Litorihabitans aurantiacus]